MQNWRSYHADRTYDSPKHNHKCAIIISEKRVNFYRKSWFSEHSLFYLGNYGGGGGGRDDLNKKFIEIFCLQLAV